MQTLCPGCVFGMWHNWGAIDAASSNDVFVAISGSTLAAACSLCELDVVEEIRRCAPLRRYIAFKLHSTLRRWLTQALPVDCHTKCQGRLVVVCRTFPSFRVTTFSQWRDKEHLIETLIAASSPLFPHAVDGVWYTDCIHVPNAERVLGTEKVLVSRTVLLPPTAESALGLYRLGQSAARETFLGLARPFPPTPNCKTLSTLSSNGSHQEQGAKAVGREAPAVDQDSQAPNSARM